MTCEWCDEQDCDCCKVCGKTMTEADKANRGIHPADMCIMCEDEHLSKMYPEVM